MTRELPRETPVTAVLRVTGESRVVPVRGRLPQCGALTAQGADRAGAITGVPGREPAGSTPGQGGLTVGARPPFPQPPYELRPPDTQGGLWAIWGTGWSTPLMALGAEQAMRHVLRLLSGETPADLAAQDALVYP